MYQYNFTFEFAVGKTIFHGLKFFKEISYSNKYMSSLRKEGSNESRIKYRDASIEMQKETIHVSKSFSYLFLVLSTLSIFIPSMGAFSLLSLFIALGAGLSFYSLYKFLDKKADNLENGLEMIPLFVAVLFSNKTNISPEELDELEF